MKAVFFDIDTQIDFMYPAGALYVPGAERILATVSELNRRAPLVISTMCTHTEDDPEFKAYPHHCVVGTVGQQKPPSLLREKRSTIPSRAEGVEQMILEKQDLDCFSNPQLMPLLKELNATRYVVYGVVTEICVKFAAFGLLKMGKRVEIVTDAVKALDEAAAGTMFCEFTAAGGHLTTAAQVH
jgi:nicotinamidase/pyrazinamidase